MAKLSARGSLGTPATRVLTTLGIAHTLRSYAHDPREQSFGEEAARALGVPAERVFKTLIVSTGAANPGGVACAVIPVSQRLSLRNMAAALGAKKTELADPALAERRTGYVLGGISPIGQRSRLATVIDASAEDFETIFVSGGRRGLDIELTPTALKEVTGASVAAIVMGDSIGPGH